MSNAPNVSSLFDRSASLTFRKDNVAGFSGLENASYRKGRAILKPALRSYLSIMLDGRTPAEIAEYEPTPQEMFARWELNMQMLASTNINSKGTVSEKPIFVLPKDAFNYTVAEDEVPEVRRINTTATTKTISAPTISFTVAAGDITLFNEGYILINWSNSQSKYARVTGVNTGTNVVQIVAHGDGATAFSAVTDFFVSTTSLDKLEIVGHSANLTNPATNSLSGNQLVRPYRNTTRTVTYELQHFQKTWVEPKFFDGQTAMDYSQFGIEARNRKDAFYELVSHMSSACLWGVNQVNSASIGNTSFAGLNRAITTNRTNLGATTGLLSLNTLDEMFIDKLGGTHGNNLYYGFCSMSVFQNIENIYNSLGTLSGVKFVDYSKGNYSMQVAVIRYRGFEVHLMPISDFMDNGTRTFPNPLNAGNGYADKLFIIDPSAVKFAIGQQKEVGPVLFHVEKNVELPSETFRFAKHAIHSTLSHILLNQQTSGVIEGITGADLTA